MRPETKKGRLFPLFFFFLHHHHQFLKRFFYSPLPAIPPPPPSSSSSFHKTTTGNGGRVPAPKRDRADQEGKPQEVRARSSSAPSARGGRHPSLGRAQIHCCPAGRRRRAQRGAGRFPADGAAGRGEQEPGPGKGAGKGTGSRAGKGARESSSCCCCGGQSAGQGAGCRASCSPQLPRPPRHWAPGARAPPNNARASCAAGST